MFTTPSIRHALLLTALASSACGDDGSPAPAIDAQGSDATIAIDAMSTCNSLTQLGPVVEETQVAEERPTALGGVIPDGTYYLTAITRYTGTGGATGGTGTMRQATSVELPGASTEFLLTEGGSDTRNVFQSVIAGTQVTYTPSCGEGEANGFSYSVLAGPPTQILLMQNMQVDTYELQ